MKIAILVGGLPPLYNGGTEIATAKIAEYATKAGHEVHVLAGDSTGKGYKDDYGFAVHTIASVSTRLAFGAIFGWKAMKVLAEIKPDLIHAQALYMAPAAWRAKRKWGIPYLLYERGGIYRPSPLNVFYRVFLKDATRVVAQTEHQKDALLKYVNRNDIEVIPNGIETERFGIYDKAQARELLGLSPTKQIVLSVGRCRPEKNLSVFVKAAQLDAGKRDWILVGDGPELEKLKAMANGAVRFIGAVNNNDIPKYMAAADVLVNTSLTEGFPLAVLEGMAAGLPVIATNVTGIPEIVKHSVNGYLVAVDSPHAVCARVNDIVGDWETSLVMGRANRQKARTYTWGNVVRRLYGEP